MEPFFAIVELMGHSRIAGKISEQIVAGANLLRVDVPAVDELEAFTKFYGASAIYAITPTDEATCLHAVRHFAARPVDRWVLPEISQLLPETIDDFDPYDDEDDDEYEDLSYSVAKIVRRGDYLVLDTETTGLDETAEVVQIAIIDDTGQVLLDAMVKPSKTIPEEATAIHGITDEMVADALPWYNLVPQIQTILENRDVLIWNAVYDMRVMEQSWQAHGNQFNLWRDKVPAHWWCAMTAYANAFHNGRWQKLTSACEARDVPIEAAHTALGDAKMTLALMKKVWGSDGIPF